MRVLDSVDLCVARHAHYRPTTTHKKTNKTKKDHLNPELRAALTEWLTMLRDDVGFAGWRFDFTRGYGARFITEYVGATLQPHELSVGEYW